MIGKSRRICFQVQKSYGARIQLPFLLIIAQQNSKDSFRLFGTWAHQELTSFQIQVSTIAHWSFQYSLVARGAHYLCLQKETVILVVPVWPSSCFSPLLANKYWLFITGCFTLNGSQALTLGRNLIIPWFSTSTGEVGKLTFEFLQGSSSFFALWVDF